MTFFQDITPSDYLGNNNEPGVLAFEALEADRQLPLPCSSAM